MFIAVPIQLLIVPCALTLPLDAVLSIVMPLHAHVGLTASAADYIPRFAPSGSSDSLLFAARCGILFATGTVTLGLLSLSTGPGLTVTIRNMWNEKKPNYSIQDIQLK